MIATSVKPGEMRVSFREAKEESYRALRAGGYSWGISQTAGRLAGVAQVLWGTGVRAVAADASRWPRRTLTHRRRGTNIIVSTRGLSWAISGPPAVAAALGNPGCVVWLKGSPLGPELAAAVWDMVTPPGATVSWGSRTHGGWMRYHLADDGSLWQHIGSEPVSLPPQRSVSAFITASEAVTGDIALSVADRSTLMSDALRSGVSVATPEWEKLMSRARKFLVPE